jgi:hypothetical protein
MITIKEPTEPLADIGELEDDKESREARLMDVKGYILIIQKPDDSNLYGPVERSFVLDVVANRTFFFWTSISRNIDAYDWVQKDLAYWKSKYPSWKYNVYDARSSQLPIIIDWKTWLDAHEPSDINLSGIRNKYYARNLKFVVKEL